MPAVIAGRTKEAEHTAGVKTGLQLSIAWWTNGKDPTVTVPRLASDTELRQGRRKATSE